MKLGGLFSGVGGFELAWTQLGHEVAWMCEIDPKARAVLRERFPGVTIYEDVCDIDPKAVEAVDVLTGGSPCQGFSIAGKRTGLQHEQSGLFVEYIRIMDGLAARGLQLAVWENVPGILSIKNPDGQRSFPHVIAAFLGADDPAPLNAKRKWNSGVASYGGREVAWRVLDSQHFGVPQRRRRVFACVAFGGADDGRAERALLAVGEGVRRDFEAGGEAGQEAAGAAAESVSPAVTDKWAKGTGGPAGDETQNLVLQPFRKSRRAQSSDDHETWVSDSVANTLNVFDVGDTRTTHAVVEPWGFSAGNSSNARSMGETEGIAPPIRAGASGTNQAPTVGPVQHKVRRLTPVECERLQGFPDGWTDVPGASDSSRYKAMGNAVTVPVVKWILQRATQQDQQQQ